MVARWRKIAELSQYLYFISCNIIKLAMFYNYNIFIIRCRKYSSQILKKHNNYEGIG